MNHACVIEVKEKKERKKGRKSKTEIEKRYVA